MFRYPLKSSCFCPELTIEHDVANFSDSHGVDVEHVLVDGLDLGPLVEPAGGGEGHAVIIAQQVKTFRQPWLGS